MRLLCLILLTGFLHAQAPTVPVRPGAQQPQQPEQPKYKPDELCTLEGIVRDGITGEPLRKADLTLMRVNANTPSSPSTTSTNAEGKFAMKGIEPGQYRLNATRPGYVRAEFGARGNSQQGSTLTLDKGQSMKALEFKLSPHAVISGRIVDEDGDPVQNAGVQLLQTRFFQGRKQSMPIGFGQTNDLGEFRIFGIAAGKYYLSAISRMGGGYSFAQDRSATPQPNEDYVPTYFPGTLDMSTATQLRIATGTSLQGVTFTVRKARTFKVKGQVLGGGAGRNRGGMVSMMPKGGGEMGMAMMMNRMMSNWRAPNGDFEIRGIRPGSYILRAEYYEPDLRLSGTAQVEVTDRDLENLTLQLTPGVELSGSIRLEGEGTLTMEDLSVYLEPKGNPMMMGNFSARVKEGGSFKIASLSSDEFNVRVNGMPPEYYLKAVRFGDTDAMKDGLDLARSGASAAVEVTLSPAAAQLEGSVADEKGNAVNGAVVLLRTTKTDQASLLLNRSITTDQYGKFKIRSITPGEYHLLAFDAVEGTDPQDPDLFAQHESSALKLVLKESAMENRQLKALKEDPNAR